MFFRSPDLQTMINVSLGLVGAAGVSSGVAGVPLLVAGAAFATVVPSAHRIMAMLDGRTAWALLAAAIAGVSAFIFAGHSQTLSFIYFQF